LESLALAGVEESQASASPFWIYEEKEKRNSKEEEMDLTLI
jgi:hypothetical protein